MLNTLKQEIKKGKWKANDFLDNLGLISHPHLRKGKTILAYHGVDYLDCRKYNSKFIGANRLFKQLKWFKENCEILPLNDFWDAQSSSKHQICLTFDDGFKNNYSILLPMLEKLNIPATFFITAIRKYNKDILWADYLDLITPNLPEQLEFNGSIFKKNRGGLKNIKSGLSLKYEMSRMDTQSKLDTLEAISKFEKFRRDESLDVYWQLLTQEDIRTLSRHSLISIGSHGVWHNNLSQLKHEDAVKELTESKDFIEEWAQKEIKSIAYPDGSYTRELIDESSRIGYKFQLAVEYLFPEDRDDPRILNRLGNNPYISLNNQIRAIGKGRY